MGAALAGAVRYRALPLLLAAACGPNVAIVSNEETGPSLSITSNVNRTPTYTPMVTDVVTTASAVPLPPRMELQVSDVTVGARAAPVELEPVEIPDGGVTGLDVSVHLALGLPDSSGVGQATRWLLVRPQYVVSYDTTRKVPNWSSWKLEASDFGTASRATTFRVDPLLPINTPQARDDDYRNSGFDRGHLCPSADRTFSDADNDATFFLTNVVPQTHASNAGPWLDLEDESRQLANLGKRLVIIAGPIFGASPHTIGTGVAVPTAMFKVAVVLDGPANPTSVTTTTKIYAAIIPNAAVISGSWRQWQVTARAIEQQTGLDFLADLPRSTQDLLEQRLDP